MQKISLNISEEMKEDLLVLAKAWDRDMSWVIRKFIQEGIDENLLPEQEQ